MATPLAALPASLGATRVRASALSLRRASPRVNTFRRVVSARPVLQLSNRRALVVAAAAPEAATVLPEIVASFNLATFTPQVFWLAMIFAPRHPVTRAVMGSWLPIFWATGVHFFVDYVGFNQPGALEEAAKFGQVFDPSIPPWLWADGSVDGPLRGFQSMLENPNFVTEEWAHVLAWDLFVGRWMWLDAVARDVPLLGACLLTTNFTGPPGLLQYFFVCLLSGKGLPSAGTATGNATVAGSKASSESKPLPSKAATTTPNAGALVARLWGEDVDGTIIGYSPEAIVAACADDVVWEDLCAPEPHEGRAAVFAALSARAAADASAGARVVVERRSDGTHAAGFTWHRAETNGGDDASRGLRGTTFVELDAEGRVRYVRECAEPILKPGGATAGLLKAVAQPPSTPPGPLAAPRAPSNASDLVSYLWREVQGTSGFREEALRNFSESIVYEDLNFDAPFVGKTATAAFLEEFDIPGLAFVPDRISDGDRACCFTWEVDLGVEGAARVKGISYYECEGVGEPSGSEEGSVRVTYVRDIPEPTMKPPPLQALAAAVNPATRVFATVPPEREMVASARDR